MFEWILLFSLLGLVFSLFIYKKKREGEALPCFFHTDCNKAIMSKYNTLLGYPNEIIGIVYFWTMSLLSLILLAGVMYVGGVYLPLIMAIIAGIASVHALSLILIQVFILKDACEYCLVCDLSVIAMFVLLVISLF